MIRKLLYGIGGLSLIVVLAVIVLFMNLSTIGSYVVKKITGGEVVVNKFEHSIDGGRFVLKLSDLTVKGALEGTVKRIDIVTNFRRRPFLKSTVISDFDLTLVDLKRKTRFLPLPAELLEIKRGSIAYNKQKIFIDELTIENLKTGRPFVYNLKAHTDTFFKSMRISGEGFYRGKSSELKGTIHITGLDLSHFSKRLKGVVVVRGPFTFAKQSFTYQGPFEMSGFEVEDSSLKKPLVVNHYAGNAKVAYANETADINIENIKFLNTTFFINLKTDRKDLATFDLSSGFFDVQEVKNFIALENIAKGSKKIWDAIQGGKVKITRFHYEKKKPVHADLELKDMGFVYKDMNFSNVGGHLNVDNYKITISKGRGTFKASHFTDATGFLSLAEDKKAIIRGKYSVNLRDVPYMLDGGKVKFKHGMTYGVMEIEGDKTSGYKISGTGKVENADVSWQKICASARGSYKFTDEEITFDPLIIRKGGTDMVIRGTWGKKSMGIFVKGNLDVDQIKQHITFPFPIKGVTFLDVVIQKRDRISSIDGDVVMDDISFTIPGFMKKDKGIRSACYIKASIKEERIDIEHLVYSLDILRINGKGSISPERKMNFDIGMNVQAVERITPLFFFEGQIPKGDFDINMAFKDLTWPVQKIPNMRGFARINNGFLKLPWFTEPLKEISLNAEFKGDTSQILVKRIVCGQTAVGKSQLVVRGQDNPRFSLSATLDSFNLNDFKSDSQTIFHSLHKDSFMAKVAGDFSLQAGTIILPHMSGTQLMVSGDFYDRKLNVRRLAANVIGGYADTKGEIDLSQSIPMIRIQGKALSVNSGHLLRAFGAKTSAIEGEGIITGNLFFKGEKWADFKKTLQGDVAMYSRNGTIQKWNLLAKIFSLLNLYDLFRGKVSFTEAGLKYTKMGASFMVQDGLFTTENFVIDSPSMLITGKGGIDAKNQEIDGTITVSPLVAIDKTINKVPILRSIVRSKDRGFIYASYSVTGNIEDPNIGLNFVNTIGGRTIDTLKNVITLPVELFERK